VREIGYQVGQASTIANRAVDEATNTTQAVETLSVHVVKLAKLFD
jgi:hypothetical protein